MKTALFCLIVLMSLLNFSCRRNVESSPIAANEKFVETPQPAPTTEKFEEIDIIDQFAAGQDNRMTSLDFEDYRIKRVTVKKKDDFDGTLIDVNEAVLSKKGKTLARFEGTIHSLGNSMSFGLYPFLGGSEKQLLVIDESPRSDREWIVGLTPKFEIMFDAADYNVQGGHLRLVDIDKDGVYELLYGKFLNEAFVNQSNGTRPVGMIVFKFEPKTRKYVPATHFFTDYTLRGIAEKVREFNESKNKSLDSCLEIFMTYVYAGKEDEGWKFFDKEGLDFSSLETSNGKVKGKQNIIEHIKTTLNKDPIYKCIRKDLNRAK